MFAYNPTVNNQAGAIRGAGAVNAANTQAAATQQVGQDIGGALLMIGNLYANDKATKVKADSYGQIGEILASSMFKDNPQASIALKDLKAEKNPYRRVAGYEALFSMLGPISNSQMAQNRPLQQTQIAGQKAFIGQAEDAAAGNSTAVIPDAVRSSFQFVKDQ